MVISGNQCNLWINLVVLHINRVGYNFWKVCNFPKVYKQKQPDTINMKDYLGYFQNFMRLQTQFPLRIL